MEQEEQAVTDAYDMRSNIKGKPGSQGTLFQVKDKSLLNPHQRWGQGYTPERLNAVRGALRTTEVQTPYDFYDQPSHETQQKHGFNEFGARERVAREISKTTIPPEHLRGIHQIGGNPDEGTHGTYHASGGYASRNTVDYDMASGRSEDHKRKTLVHEIGHHVNMTLAPTPHVHTLVAQLHATKEAQVGTSPTQTDIAMKRSKVAAGVDEAQADNYAVEHFRTGGRKSTGTTTGAYEDNHTSDVRERHYPGYNDIREPQKGPSWHAMQEAQFNPGLFSAATARDASQAELRRRIGAHADANREALRAHIEAARQ